MLELKGNIGLIDADLLDGGTRHPNLALLKLSGYYKSKNKNVNLLESYDELNEYDNILVSKVFNFTESPDELLNKHDAILGGTGFYEDGGENLPCEIEHHMPDYTLYDNFIEKEISRGINPNRFVDYKEFSIGFTTRGCFRKCEFCVNKKYDKAFKHSPLEEFYDPDRQRIYLWDDNFLAYSGWEEVLNELKSTGKYFKFRQGLDLRLMTERKAKALSEVKYYGDFIFAFDNIEERGLIENKLELWNKYANKTTRLYVLCAFDRSDNYDGNFWKQDIIDTFERIKILMKHQSLPYVMRFEEYENSPFRGMYINLARWCNQPSQFKKKSFREFCLSNQNPNSDKTCASIRYMDKFEEIYPDVAEEYFDIKFEEGGLKCFYEMMRW